MTDFPRGWTFQSNTSAGSTASVTVPATAGVVHVLDSYTVSLVAVAAAAAAAAQVVQINTGSGLQVFSVLAYPGGANGRDSDSLSGLDLATPPGGALVVTFQVAAPANYQQMLVIQGHDI